MNLRNFRGKGLKPREEDNKLTEWWKKFQINHGIVFYEFDSIEEFDDYSLSGKIKRLNGISLSYIRVDSVWKEKDDVMINVLLKDGTKDLAFKRLYPGPYHDFGVNQKCWLELNKLRDGDELSMLRFIYHNHGYYQLIDISRKDGDGSHEQKYGPKNKEGDGQSIDDLITEVYKQPINNPLEEGYKK